MKTIRKFFKKYEKFIKYCSIGVTGISLDISTFWLLTMVAGINIQLANFISISLSQTNNFILNAIFNFKVKDNLFSRYLKYYSVALVGYAITALILFIFVQLLHYNQILVKILAILIVTVIQFSLHQSITFKTSNAQISYKI
ncbi:GtrA family protein [Neobacillus drentensis]|uniref:GtrA family protein n=1 Tax=Neobacillus drentensis TaxID=220684 RepID=UPI0030011497